jgi:nucleoside-diphosphate-sugar epimerase
VSSTFVAGATGLLGSRIAHHLLTAGTPVRALVRPGTDGARRSALAALAARGLELVVGDITDPVGTLSAAIGDASTVISAVQGGPETIVDGQLNLVRAAEKAGAVRFIPSDFAVDKTRLDDTDHVTVGWRRRAAAAYADTPLAVISVLNGTFVEDMVGFLRLVDWSEGTLTHWGDPDQPLDLTTVDDTAAYTAAVALDPSLPAGTLRFAGEVLTMRGFRDAIERGTGRSLRLRTVGGADELRAEIERRAARTDDPFEYAALQHQWCLVTGKGKFAALDNARYPRIAPTSVADFVRTVAPAA